MRTSLFGLAFLLICFSAQAQWWGQTAQYFDGNDTLPDFTLTVHLDTADASNVWQIGLPQKMLFDSASTYPNALLTDTLNPYYTNDTSRFIVTFPEYFEEELSYGILAFQWNQKLDLDSLNDWGLLEFTVDSGLTWQNALDNPYVYNLYGFHPSNVDTMGLDSIAFTGTDSVWKDIWFCLEVPWLFSQGNFGDLQIRFSIVSDSVQTGHEGWMIDNMISGITYFHTVEEKPQENYLEVYPNPTNGRIHIQARKIQAHHVIHKIELINQMGQVVDTYTNTPTRFFIDAHQHPPGAYFLKVQTNIKTETVPIILQTQ